MKKLIPFLFLSLQLGAWPLLTVSTAPVPAPCTEGTTVYVSGPIGYGYYQCERRGWVTINPAVSGIFDVRATGAKGDGASDDETAIMAASALASAASGIVFFPPGVYAHSGVLDFGSGTLVMGSGDASILRGTTPAANAVRFSGAVGSSITDLRFESSATTRLLNSESATVLFYKCSGCAARRLQINGSPSVGIMVQTSTDVIVDGSYVESTLADGIHVVDGSTNIKVTNNFAYNTGDDSFSVVAYLSAPQTDSVLEDGNVSIQSHARGLSCVGASNCVFTNNRVESPLGHGIDVAYEAAYDTYTPGPARIEHNVVNHVQSAGMNPFLAVSANNVRVNDLRVSNSNTVYCTLSTNVSLVGVVVTNALGVGISGLTCTGLSIVGSTVNGAAAGGIRVQGLTNGNFSMNTLLNLFTSPWDGVAGAIDIYISQNVTGTGNTVSQNSVTNAPATRIIASPGSSIGITVVPAPGIGTVVLQ